MTMTHLEIPSVYCMIGVLPYGVISCSQSAYARIPVSRIFAESQDEYGQEKLFVDSLFQVIEKSQLVEIDTAQITVIT